VKRWRTLDVHGKRTFPESGLPRIICPQHGKITAAVPWARHDDRFSRPFEEFAAWKAAHMPWTRAAAELRVTWEALANVTARVAADAAAGTDRLEGLRRIGIDEKSWGKGSSKYLVIVTDHDAGRVAWIGERRCQATVEAFFAALGPERARLLTHVSADGAEWIHPVVRAKAPQAELCLDAFHVVKWAGEKLDELRRRLAGELRAAGRGDEAATLGSGMWALRKDERKLTPGQRGTLARIAVTNQPLYKGYLIKEQIREAFKVKGGDGKTLMRGVTAWAHRCRIPEFTRLAKTLSRYKTPIESTLDGGPSNGRAEAVNAQVNALIARARGFRSAAALMNMIDFVHGGQCPESPYA
jgi:transposase